MITVHFSTLRHRHQHQKHSEAAMELPDARCFHRAGLLASVWDMIPADQQSCTRREGRAGKPLWHPSIKGSAAENRLVQF